MTGSGTVSDVLAFVFVVVNEGIDVIPWPGSDVVALVFVIVAADIVGLLLWVSCIELGV